MMEVIVFILFVLTVIMVSLMFAIKRKIDLFNIDDPSLQNRLDTLKKEIESLILRVKASRGEEQTEQQAERPPSVPVVETEHAAGASPSPLSTAGGIETAPEIKPAASTIPVYDMPGEPAPEPSRWVQSVRDILGRIWQWILVGEEYRPQGVPWNTRLLPPG